MPIKIASKSAALAAAPETAPIDNTEVLAAIEDLKTTVTAQVKAGFTDLTSAIAAIMLSASAPSASKEMPATTDAPARKKAPGASNPQTAAAPVTVAAAKAASTSPSSVSQPPASAAATGGQATKLDPGMSRRQLADLATSMGINASGVSADDLRRMIGEAQPQAAANSTAGTSEMRKILQLLIDNNYEALKPALEGPKDLANGVLGCGGDCMACPNPEAFPTADDQVRACFVSLHESLGVAPPPVG